MRDLTMQPWPFAYATAGGPIVLRAPVGLYLIPSLIGKIGGFHAAEQALLVQDALLLGLIFALGSVLFDTGHSRLLALAFFLGFSGMDVIGQWMVGQPLTLHLESWGTMQYSSHVTQAFWVPQHAMAGWIFAATYLLWREGRVPVAVPLAVLWLMALFSPLALIGSVPFGLHALIMGWRRKELSLPVCGALALVVLACSPSLLYLSAASGAVGAGEAHSAFRGYPSFILIEVGSFLVALWLVRKAPPFGRMTAALVAAVLLLAPFGQIGRNGDFTMRSSIPALAILSLMMARVVLEQHGRREYIDARRWIMVAWVIGLATPAGEIWRGLTWPAAPEVLCGYVGVVPGGFATYTAPLATMPAPVRPAHPNMVQEGSAHPCWLPAWRDPISGQWTLVHPY
ncbi:MAG: hypothetical protein KGJ57_12550 [Sphingomonadales bacterium]|nr:hypothetical protein [Sphingomonadales bacterium]MDE2170245.1 hypothetical protein [Sphingomonadales bacterium]